MVGAALLALGFTGLWLWALPGVAWCWGHLLAFLHAGLHLPGRVTMTVSPLGFGLVWPVPYLALPGALPSGGLLSGNAVVTVAAFAATFFIPRHLVPVIYYLRALLLIHATAIAYFFLFPGAFPYALDEYLHGMTSTSLFVITLVPAVLGFTFYVFDLPWRRRVGVTLAILGHLTLFVPLKYAMQGYLLYHGSLLYMPLFYLLFGVILDVLLFIALYGWGMGTAHRPPVDATTPLAPPP